MIVNFWVDSGSEETPCYHVHGNSCQSPSLQASAESTNSCSPTFYLLLSKYLSFAPNTLLDCLIFSKQIWIIGNWSYSTIKQTNEAQDAYGYICWLLEKHMAMREWTISWEMSYMYNFELWINKRDHNSWKYFMLLLETNQ